MRKLESTDLGILNLILELDPALGDAIGERIEGVRKAAMTNQVPAPRPMPIVEYRTGGPPLATEILIVDALRSRRPTEPTGGRTKAEIRNILSEMSEAEFETGFARAVTQGKITINGKRGPGAKYTLTAP